MNKKGHTLIETICTILIVGVLFSCAAVGVTYCLGQSEKTFNEAIGSQLKLMAKDYYIDNKNKMNSKVIFYQVLKSNNYVVNELKDYNGNLCNKSYVIIDKDSTGKIIYNSCVICDNGYTNINDNSTCNIK